MDWSIEQAGINWQRQNTISFILTMVVHLLSDKAFVMQELLINNWKTLNSQKLRRSDLIFREMLAEYISQCITVWADASFNLCCLTNLSLSHFIHRIIGVMHSPSSNTRFLVPTDREIFELPQEFLQAIHQILHKKNIFRDFFYRGLKQKLKKPTQNFQTQLA